MRNFILSLSLIFATTIMATAQEGVTYAKSSDDLENMAGVTDNLTPDNDRILANILDPDSPYYYTGLILRYMAADTTLNHDDYRHLYYGYVWQDNYKPFEPIPATDKIQKILSKGENLTTDDHLLIIEQAKEVFMVDPFSLSNLNFMIYSYGALGDVENERANYYRLRMITETIRSSGTGIMESSPYHVIYFGHAVDVMGIMDMLYSKSVIVSRTVEYFPLVGRGSRNEKGYYFNYERVYWKRPDKMPERRSAGWEINGIQVKKR